MNTSFCSNKATTQFSSACLVAALVFCAQCLTAKDYTFTKIVEEGDPVPGGTGGFTAFSTANAALSNGIVVFQGEDESSGEGIYRVSSGSISMVADNSGTPPPVFNSFLTSFDILNSTILYLGRDSSDDDVIYLDEDGTATLVLGPEISLPSANSETFSSFGGSDPMQLVEMESGELGFSFKGRGDSTTGIYTYIGGILSKVADTTDTAPSTATQFTYFGETVMDSNGDVVFEADPDSTGGSAVFGLIDGTLVIIADGTMEVPGGSGNNFSRTDEPWIKNGCILFEGIEDVTDIKGIYLKTQGSSDPTLIVNESTIAPGTSETLTDFGTDSVAIANGLIYFSAEYSGGEGIYCIEKDGTNLTKIIDTSDTLDGRAIDPDDGFTIEHTGYDGTSLVFLVTFDVSDTKAIYRADIYRSDLTVGPKRGKQKGSDVYNTSGAGQKTTIRFEGNKKGKFFFIAENEASSPDDFLFRGTRKNRFLKITYTQLSPTRKNATGAITRGKYTATVPAEGTAVFKAIVRGRSAAKDRRASRDFKIRATSTGDGSVDLVRAKVVKK